MDNLKNMTQKKYKHKQKLYITKTDQELCSFAIFMNAGSVFDPVGKEGLAHLAEHVFATINANTAEEIGIHISAFTSFGYMLVEGSFMSSNKDVALRYLGSIFNDKYVLDKTLISKQISSILTEKKLVFQNTVDKIWQIRHSEIWKGHPLGRDFFGNRKSLKSISQKDLVVFREKYMCNSSTVFSFIGDVTPGEINTYLDITSSEVPVKKYNETKAPKVVSQIIIKKDFSSCINISIRMFNFDPNKIHYYYLFKEILADNWSSVINSYLRDKLNIAYWPFAKINIFEDEVCVSVVSQVECKNIKQLLKDIKSLIQNKECISKNQFNTIKKMYSLHFLREHLTCESIARWNAESLFYCGKIIEIDDFIKDVTGIDFVQFQEFINNNVDYNQIHYLGLSE